MWLDRAKAPAKFRGVSFFVDTSEYAGGRRLVVHEFPGKDEPFAEDLGRKARAFTVEGYVLGKDYMRTRDALRDALEKTGTGELNHPFHGTRRVAVQSFRIRESKADGGMATFSIEFVETPAQAAQPAASVDNVAALAASASAAKTAAGEEFLTQHSPGRLIDSVADSLRSATLKINNVLTTVSMEEQRLANLSRKVSDLSTAASSLASLPEDMLAGLGDIFDLFDNDGALLGVYDFDPGVRPPATTASRLEEQTNFDATQRLIQRLAVIQAASLATEQTYSSHDDALRRRSLIADLLDEQAETADDNAYDALIQLRSDLVRAVPGDDSDLARLVSYTPPATVPAIVLAHRLYGDVSMEADILARNEVEHPGFVIGGRALEILSK